MSNRKYISTHLWILAFVSCRLPLSFTHFSIGLILFSLILPIRGISHLLYWTSQLSFPGLSLVLWLWDGFVSATPLKLFSIKGSFCYVSWICDTRRKAFKILRWSCAFKNELQDSALSGHCPASPLPSPSLRQRAHLCSAINPVFTITLCTSHLIFWHRSQGLGWGAEESRERNWCHSFLIWAEKRNKSEMANRTTAGSIDSHSLPLPLLLCVCVALLFRGKDGDSYLTAVRRELTPPPSAWWQTGLFPKGLLNSTQRRKETWEEAFTEGNECRHVCPPFPVLPHAGVGSTQGIPVMFDVQDVSLLTYVTTLLSLQWFTKNLLGSSNVIQYLCITNVSPER